MGAFFLYRTDAAINLLAVEELFRAKGFSGHSAHKGQTWTLWHFRKQLMPDAACTAMCGDVTAYALGAFSYQGLGIQGSLDALLRAHQEGPINAQALVGGLCLLICKPGRITIVTDPLNLIHVFGNENQTVFSSSFAAVLKAGPGKFRVNIPAVLENALAGYMIGPDTTAKGIHLVDHRCPVRVAGDEVVFHQFAAPGSIQDARPIASPRAACLGEQMAELDSVFGQLRAVVDESGGVDIGLSGGYDSRLLVLLAKRHFSKVTAHSHYHRETTEDEAIARRIAAALDIPLYRCESAKQPVELDDEEFERNLDDTAAFADGRVIQDYSWMSVFRTRQYRLSVLRGARFAMNGLGGELYRNHDSLLWPRIYAREWIKARVFGPAVCPALPKAQLRMLLDFIQGKAGARLGLDFSGWISRNHARRYYGELYSVYGAAVRMSVDNQLAFSLSPFLDLRLRRAVYRALPHLGLAGRVERELIYRLNSTVAALPSTYGYSFDRAEPVRALAKLALRGTVPFRVQNGLQAWRLGLTQTAAPALALLCQRHPRVRRAVELMRDPAFGLVWERVVQDRVLLLRVVSIGLMMLKYEDCLEL